MERKIISLVLFALILFKGNSQEIIQFRGPNRTGKYNETNLLKKWPEGGPTILWSTKGVGKGYSSVATDGKTLYITSLKDTSDYLTAISLDGKIKWQTRFGNSWIYSFPDSRCTPTIHNDSIFVVSGWGEVACIGAKDGKLIWKVWAGRIYGGRTGNWGYSESLLLYKDKVMFTPGGNVTTTIALKKTTGELVWKTASLSDTCAYVSPILIKHGGKDVMINIGARNIFCVDPNNGKLLSYFSEYNVNRPTWHPHAPIINCVSPLYKDNQIYLTSGYNHVGMLLNLSEDASRMDLVWKDSVLDNHHGGVVEVDGYIYGSNWKNNANGNWSCIDWKTGNKMWEEKWFTKGSIIFADGMLYLYEERTGNLALVKPNPNKFELVSSFKVAQGTGPHWSHPMIFRGVLYIRHGDELVAYDIKSH